ncbi:4711_t:CDS:1, partial [Cetraspora pellucida]
MSSYDKNDTEASTKSDNNSNKKTKVKDTHGGNNVKSWIWLYFDLVYINNMRYADCKVEM